MSLDPYHFHMVLRLEERTRAERLEADLQAARIVHAAWRLWRAVRVPRRAAHPDPSRLGATMQPRRIS